MRNWFRSTILYRWWSKFLTWFGDIMVATELPTVKARHLRDLMRLVKRGDVICRKYNYYLDSKFIKGEYTHSGVLTCFETIKHFIAEGGEFDDVLDFTKDTDGFIILRPPYETESDKQNTINWAIATEGEYDFLFDKKEFEELLKKSKLSANADKYFYCHEFTACALFIGGVVIEPEGDVIYAADLMKKCLVIYDSGEN